MTTRTASQKVQATKNHAEGMRAAAARKIASFTEKLAANPMHAFEWSASAFGAAGEDHVGAVMIALIDNGHERGATEEQILEAIERTVQQHLINAARYITSTSSSETANLTKRAETAAWGKLAGELPRLIG